MGKPAARITDMHACPLTPVIPHVGGPILPPGVINVLIGGLPAATVGSIAFCVAPAPPPAFIPDPIAPPGALNVLIGGRPAARQFDTTLHGGKIVLGCLNVLIGSAGAGQQCPPVG